MPPVRIFLLLSLALMGAAARAAQRPAYTGPAPIGDAGLPAAGQARACAESLA